jgi:hypothetical protein
MSCDAERQTAVEGQRDWREVIVRYRYVCIAIVFVVGVEGYY